MSFMCLKSPQLDYMPNRLFRVRPNGTSMLSITGPLWGKSTLNGGLTAHYSSNAEKVSVSSRLYESGFQEKRLR